MTRVAAIDCGTNSIRLLVADLDDAGLHDVTRRLEIVRLGEGVDRTGMLAPQAIERTRVVLAGYAVAIRQLDAQRVRMVATSASRDAANAADFTAMVTATLGQPPEVITGNDEAALSFAGAVTDIGTGTPPYLVIDIGGGSTEFVLGGSTVQAAHSVDIGCVRMTERHLRDDPPSAAQVRAAERDIVAAIARVRERVLVARAETVVGLAGTVTTVAAIALGLDAYDPARIHGTVLTAADVRGVAARLLTMPRAERAALSVMHPGRVDVIAAGALVLSTIVERLRVAQVVVSEHDILDGIALSLR
ncbi:MAG: exopolyphosphatase [Pseudonocardiales bacterium]|nr:MAG: exopolyphosphatase [Pseudonocardiales bacterium]